MSQPAPYYNVVAEDPPWSDVEFALSPGQNAIVRMKTTDVHTAIGDAMVQRVIADHEATKDILRDFT